MTELNLNDLSKEQLVNLLITTQSQNQKPTKIRFFDIEITSIEPLRTVEKTLNRIIKTNKSFIEYKKTKFNRLVDNWGDDEE